ncbi:DNA-binding protein (plasmid) [Paraburkholderia kururiensis]|uniref:helix-turn-helix domain-containing protein n=1 Tax=Paraburkholderia kururiensis TaxID=984307 RepID=UPI0039A5F36D
MLPPISVHHPRYAVLQAHLRQLRVGAGLTQVDLARRLKVDQSYVSKIERGERYVDILFYLDWCRACEADPSHAVTLLGEKGA